MVMDCFVEFVGGTTEQREKKMKSTGGSALIDNASVGEATRRGQQLLATLQGSSCAS